MELAIIGTNVAVLAVGTVLIIEKKRTHTH